MKSVSDKIEAWGRAAAQGCRKLVDNVGLTSGQAALRLRLTCSLFFAPLVVCSAVSLTLSQVFSPVAVAAANVLLFGMCWLGGLLVASHGREKAVGLFAVASGAVLLAVLLAAGGTGSPLTALAGALVFESWWIWRDRRATLIGGVFAVGALAASFAVPVATIPAGPALAALWIPVVLYGVSLVLRLKAEHAGQREATGLNDLAAALDDVVMRLNGAGEIIETNHRTREMLRLPGETLLHQGLFERLHVADRVTWLCALSDLRNGARNRKLDLRLRLPAAPDEKCAATAAGVYEWFSAEIVNVGTSGENPLMILRKRDEMDALNARVDAAEQRAEEAELSKASFLASVSHELRTPLNAIIGFSDMLMHELYGRFADPRQKEHVALISEAGHHLLGVVDSVLDVSKIELGAYTITRETFDVAEALDTSLAMVSMQAERKNITIGKHVDPAIETIQADRRAVRQMLINLLSNAVKFTPEHGEVHIGASLEQGAVRFWVRDTGIGIASTDIERLGRPFVQAGGDYARKADGTGLGLALVRGLAELHGGSLVIESEIGTGTTASIRLPMAKARGGEPLGEEPQTAAEGEIIRVGFNHGAFRKTA